MVPLRLAKNSVALPASQYFHRRSGCFAVHQDPLGLNNVRKVYAYMARVRGAMYVSIYIYIYIYINIYIYIYTYVRILTSTQV